MSTNEIKKLIEINREILRWIKISNVSKVKEVLENALDTPEKRIAYEASDGVATSRKVAKIAGVGLSTISAWWNNWYDIGIAEPISVQRGSRAQKIFNLKSFNLSNLETDSSLRQSNINSYEEE